jgi:hypothetical protein
VACFSFYEVLGSPAIKGEGLQKKNSSNPNMVRAWGAAANDF